MSLPSDAENIQQKIGQLYPTARFISLGSVAAGKLDHEQEEQRFLYVSLYDHKVGSQMRPLDGHKLIIHNTYLSSHAYNIALCHLMGAATGASPEELTRRCRHNFKKFFAEQVLYRENVLIGRALLLETVLYEQDVMQEVFAGVPSHQMEEQAKEIALLASASISQHELAHYFETRSNACYAQDYAVEIGKGYEDIDAAVLEAGGAKLQTEFRCDVVATMLNLRSATGFARGDLLRVQMFIWYILAELVSLMRSAMATAKAALEEEQSVDLYSVNVPQHSFGLQFGRDENFDTRVTALERVLERIAEQEGMQLFDESAGFPLTRRIRGILQEAERTIDSIADEPMNGLGGTDARRRGLAQLVAESLKGYDAGATFLLWRSKKYNRANGMHFE